MIFVYTIEDWVKVHILANECQAIAVLVLHPVRVLEHWGDFFLVLKDCKGHSPSVPIIVFDHMYRINLALVIQ